MPINANVTNNQITASVGETQIDVTVSGGVGPTGPTGPTGPAGSLVMASATTLGGVRIGGGVSIDGNGVISVSTAYAASSHAHGFITAAGTITDNAVSPAFVAAPAVVTTSGFLRQGEFGTTAGTIAAGNHTHDDRYYTESEVNTLLDGKQPTGSYVLTTDSRLSDARQPLSHSHAAGDITSGTFAASLLPLASANTRGAVRIGTGITIDQNGVISASGGVSSWNDLTDRPSTFAPAAHAATHDFEFGSDPIFDQDLNSGAVPTFGGLTISSGQSGGLQIAGVIQLYRDNDSIWRFNAADGGSITGWTIASSQVTGLGTAAAASTSDFAEAVHDHAWSDITSGVPSTFTPSAHNHAASEITSGTLDIARIPVGTSSTTVAAGNDARFVSDGNKGDITVGSSNTSWTINAGAVVTADLADSAVTSAKIAASAVTDAKIDTVAASKLTGTVSAARLPTVLEQPVTGGNTGTSVTLSLASGSVQTWTLNGNCTFTMPAATAGASLTVILTQNGTNTATFTGVLWSGGTAPTITATANKRDILVFVSDGTNWYGTAAQNF